MCHKPGADLVFVDPQIPVSSAAHFPSALSQQAYLSALVFGDGNIKGAASQIVNKKSFFCPVFFQNAHDCGHRLLNERSLSDAGKMRRLQRRVLFHLIEGSRYRDDGHGFGILPDLFGKVAVQIPQKLGAAFHRGLPFTFVFAAEPENLVRSHVPLEQGGGIILISCRQRKGFASVKTVASLVHIDGRGSHVGLFGTFVYFCFGTVVDADGAVGGTEINADIMLHGGYLRGGKDIYIISVFNFTERYLGCQSKRASAEAVKAGRT